MVLWVSFAWAVIDPGSDAGNSSEPRLNVNELKSHKHIGIYLEVLEDPEQRITLERLLSGKYESRFRRLNSQKINFGYSRSTYWLRLKTLNPTEEEKIWFLALWGDADFITFYFPYLPGPLGYRQMETGRKVPRESFSFAFPVREPPGPHTYYIKLKSDNTLMLFPTALEPTEFRHQKEFFYAIAWLFFGIMLSLSIYNLFIYLSVREKSYLYLLIFILTYSTMLFIELGFLTWFIGKEPHWLIIFLVFSSLLSLLLLTRSFLNTITHFRWLDKIMLYTSALIVPSYIGALFMGDYYSSQFATLYAIITVLLSLLCGILSLLKGVREARWYMIASTLFLVALLSLLLDFLAILPTIDLPHQFVSSIGFVLMVFVFSLGIFNKLSSMRTERIKALEAMHETERKLQNVFENATEGIYRLNPDLSLVDVNQAMADIFGYDSVEEFKGCTCLTQFLEEGTP
ncbi:MAG: PAS domain-containing protein, partial [bacterium]|nr:PAS domain-containing protein [bacterium]